MGSDLRTQTKWIKENMLVPYWYNILLSDFPALGAVQLLSSDPSGRVSKWTCVLGCKEKRKHIMQIKKYKRNSWFTLKHIENTENVENIGLVLFFCVSLSFPFWMNHFGEETRKSFTKYGHAWGLHKIQSQAEVHPIYSHQKMTQKCKHGLYKIIS